jgi:GDP-D-mannose 3',5'-epimerase
LIQEKLGWRPSRPLKDGIQKTYEWVRAQVGSNVKDA